MSPHPQTVWDADELTHLQDARKDTHKFLADNLQACLKRLTGQVSGPDVAGLSMITRIMEADPQLAIKSLISLCKAPLTPDNDAWDPKAAPLDLTLSSNILNAAIAYDVLFHLFVPSQLSDRNTCRDRIAYEAKKMADAVDAGRAWWSSDLVNNHNWVNFAAIGVAGQALECDGDPTNQNPIIQNLNQLSTHWQHMAADNFKKVKAVQDLITDGSWHEGIGYMGFALEIPIAYWLGAVSRGSNDDKTKMLSKVGHYILYTQLPNQARVHLMTHGDWNWSRPQLIAVLRWAAKRFKDPYAAEAARRWDLAGDRITRSEMWLHYALEYVAYDPEIHPIEPATSGTPLDLYNEDQESMIMRSSWDHGPNSNTLVVGFKAGVFGGRGNYERMRNCDYPGGILNYGHDHEDDLGLWIYGKGGWLLPEAVGYSCCLDNSLCCLGSVDPESGRPTSQNSGEPSDYHSTPWHNTLLFNGQGQLGDDKSGDSRPGYPSRPRADSVACTTNGFQGPAWFYQREASMPLHVSTDNYAFARGDGKKLYPSTLKITTLLRTVGFSRENGGFIALQDRVCIGGTEDGECHGPALTIEQLFHSMCSPPPSPDRCDPLAKCTVGPQNEPSWLKLTSLNTPLNEGQPLVPATVLGICVLSPNPYIATITNQFSNLYQEFMDDDGRYGYVRLAPPTPESNIVFLEVLWPMKIGERLPNVQPLESGKPWRGFKAPLSTSTESWIYNLQGKKTSAGVLIIEGTSQNDIGIKRADSTGKLERVVVLRRKGGGGKLQDQNGTRTLLDLPAEPNQDNQDKEYQSVLEVAFKDKQALLSGTAKASQVQFYGPSVDVNQVFYNGKLIKASPKGDMVCVNLG